MKTGVLALRRRMGLALALIVFAAGCAGARSQSDSAQKRDAARRTCTLERNFPPANDVRAFVPGTCREEEQVVMPVTFPDGTNAELVYPAHLDLAGMGIQPDVSYLSLADRPPRHHITFVHGEPIDSLLDGRELIRTYKTRNGLIGELWETTGQPSRVDPMSSDWLVLRLHAWTLLVSVTSAPGPDEVASVLHAYESVDGFPVVEVSPPLGLSDETGEGQGPSLTIGDADPRPNLFKVDEADRMVFLEPFRGMCSENEISLSDRYAALCLGEGETKISAGIYGDPSFVETVFSGLQARGIGSASGPSPVPDPGRSEGSGPLPFAFYPDTYSEGQWVVMPVTFPGGTRAELLFSEDLRPQDLGVSAITSGGLGGVDRDMNLLYGDGSGIMGAGPLRTYEGYGGGTVEVWDSPDESFPCPSLVYRFGPWFVEVRTCQDELSQVEEATWARSLIGQESDDGFLVLQAVPPLQLTPTGGHAGPQLWLQGESSWPFITIIPRKCDPNRPGGEEEASLMDDGQLVSFHRVGKVWYADWCAGGEITIQVESTEQEYVEAAAKSLRVRNVTEAEE